MSFLRSLILLIPALLMAADGPSAPAPSDAPGGAGGGVGGSSMGMLIMLPLIFGLMYFIVIRPQRREEKKRKELMSALNRGDKVTTIGGIHGEVVAVGEATVDLRVNVSGAEAVLRFNKGAIASTIAEPKAT